MTLPARITPKMCANCAHFRRRDPARGWPIAGVPASAEGQCCLPRYGKAEEVRRPWQHGADRCVEWKRIGTALVKRAGVV